MGKVPAIGTYMLGKSNDNKKFVICDQVINATGQKKEKKK